MFSAAAESATRKLTPLMTLSEFNSLTPEQAAEALRPCVDISRWVTSLVDARPFPSRTALLDCAAAAAPGWTEAEIDRALGHHPRIGEQPAGPSAEARHSRSEQAGLTASDGTTALIAAGNRAYEHKFGRVFLIRAKGRTAEDILRALRQRLENHPAQETPIIAHELRNIALLRLEGIVTS
ncbi:2-oxo-4-hydroxy-4-carboxy-5-ureidoimidazoline decarboxylase [Arthrobacter agilis]|uniref:2-oxo-4-hydroxy-4-carboxy-5-ureidoimidazoline decarboxylase n=1 Tax=Arthrobacter agilis TaxID=37921 RepID=UPI00278B6C7A|nr:2-oxo-4-hydroxy-4-carboxy-5-ureidoimidazoline decarboxylase [Arthrobacter agilis]MDQ0736524.1 2-oxo-4-hydroxy-4-carboxy-5-ureidoimidazoline decarboxylase [Arthrobacter agilis]